MSNQVHRYMDFHNFESLVNNKALTDQLVAAYQRIFCDPELWAESYTREEVLNNLRSELAGDAGIRLCMDSQRSKELLGFCWAQRLGFEAVKATIQTVQYYQALGSPCLYETLQMIIGDEPVIYVHDLGVSSNHRGQVPLYKLICPVLETLSQRTQTKRVFFWSIEGTRVFKLAERAGFQLTATVAGMQFFTGDLNSMRVHRICRNGDGPLFGTQPNA